MNFVVVLNPKGKVMNIAYWDFDETLKPGEDFLRFFSAGHQKKIKELLRTDENNNETCCATTQMNVDHKTYPLSLCRFSFENQIALVGFENESEYQEATKKFAQTFNEYTNKMRIEFKKSIQQREESIKEKFEQLQQLNSENINMRRKLEKAYIQTDMANKELEIRLVKDALTGLIGRYQYWAEMETHIQRYPDQYAIFSFIDLDDFKSINDHYGHQAGDEFLVEFANRLRGVELENTLAIRVAGDEFALFTYNLDQVNDQVYENIWKQIKKHVTKKPIKISNTNIYPSVSLGIAVYNLDTKHISELVEYADFAMYQVKRSGKGYYMKFKKEDYTKAKSTQKSSDEQSSQSPITPIYDIKKQVIGYSEQDKHTSIDEIQSSLKDKEQNAFLYLHRNAWELEKNNESDAIKKKFANRKVVIEIDEFQRYTIAELEKIFDLIRKKGFLVSLGELGAGKANSFMAFALQPDYIRVCPQLIKDIHLDQSKYRMLKNVVGYAKSQNTQVMVEGVTQQEEWEAMERLSIDCIKDGLTK